MDRPNLNDQTQFQVEDEFSDSMLKYINQVLMEEDIESKPCMFQDCSTLQATEESLYEVIRGPICVDQNVESPDGVRFSDPSASSGQSFEPQAVSDEFIETSRPSILQNPNRGNFVMLSNSRSTWAPFSWHGNLSVGICRGKAHGKNHGYKNEVIDLRALLILCAEAVSVDDRGSAIELLKQIMQHSSPFGDCTQRLAYCFGNALQARLAGTGTQIYTALSLKPLSAADMLKFFQAYLAACPLMKMSMIFANDMILKAAEKAETLHIIDFGILCGFQWPALIHGLSRRPGGPPRLRITGVELPLSGFRPEERVQETGHRLARYCKRFNVPFEYYAIAKKWETVQFEDLKVQRNEVLAVNCMCRFKNLLDETVMVNSPRDIVLNLIRNLNPDVFVQTVVNGSHHAPFFVPRFREALSYFSAMFDMFDTHLPREDQMRLGFEKEFIGREVLNIVACEGSSRIVRPQTYKQWQVRHMRAGFRQLPLDREVMKNIKDKIRTGYHPDFVAVEDGYWLLQGWRGRIMYASACWTPSRT